MIGKIHGRVDALGQDWAVIETAVGVGYVVRGGVRLISALPDPGGVASLRIESVHRDDGTRLYGFVSEIERAWFVLLITVSGVSAKLALAVLDALGPEGVATAVVSGDADAIARARGVGKKLAQRILAELAGKSLDLARTADEPDAAARSVTMAKDRGPDDDARHAMRQDAAAALVSLGFQENEAQRAVALAASEATSDLAGLVRAALAEAGRS